MKRAGDWMQTYTGRRFWPIDPRADEVDVLDIAHALSLTCRYAGHSLRFYSVAEHSCHVCDAAPLRLKPWALLHDAAEAYVVDVPRPLKPFLANYRDIEGNVLDVIFDRFGLDRGLPLEVKDIDNRILHDERQQAMLPTSDEWNLVGGPIGASLAFWQPEEAERQFLSRFDAVIGGRL
jgi:hypothetical protein